MKRSPLIRRHTFCDAEARLCFVAGNGEQMQIDPKALDPIRDKLQDAGADPAKQETPEQRTERLLGAVNGTIGKYEEITKHFDPDTRGRFHDEIANFLATTVESFDLNRDGLDGQEFARYLENVTKEIDALLAPMQAAAQSGAEKLIEEPLKKSSIFSQRFLEKKEETEQAEREKEKSLDELKHLLEGKPAVASLDPLDEKALENALSPEQVQEQLTVYQSNVQKVQFYEQTLQHQAQITAQFQVKAQQEMKVMSDSVNTASASTAVASGAAIGAAIGVWGFGIGAVIGAGIGAAAGAIAYGVGKGVYAERMKEENLNKADEFNEKIAVEKQEIAEGQNALKGQDQKVEDDGGRLNITPEKMREVWSKTAQEKDAEAAVKQQEVYGRNAAIVTEKNTLDERKLELGSALNKLINEDQKMRSKRTDDPRNSNNDVPQRSTFIGQQKADAEGKMNQITFQSQSLDNELSRNNGSLLQVEQYRTADSQKSAEMVQRINTLDQTIGRDVLGTNIQRLQQEQGIAVQADHLKSLPPVTPESFTTVFQDGFDGFGKGAKFLFSEAISPAIDAVSKGIKDWAGENSILSIAVTPITFSADMVSGLSEGVGDLTEGIATMVGHPLQTVKGLGAMCTAEGLKEMGKAMIAYKDFEDGKVGKGVGKVALNVLMTATGAGAAGQGLNATRAAFLASRAMGSGVLRSSLRAGAVGARIGITELAEGTAKIPGNLARGVGKVPGVVRNLGSNGVEKWARLVAIAETDIAKATIVSEKALAATGKAAELGGRSADDIAALLKDGAGMKEFGVTGAKDIGGLLKLREALKTSEGAQRAVGSAKHALELAEIHPKLAKVSTMNPRKIPQLIDAINAENSGGFGSRIGEILHKTEEGVVLVDATGRLLYLDDATKIAECLESCAAMKATTEPARRAMGAAIRRRAEQQIGAGTLSHESPVAVMEATPGSGRPINNAPHSPGAGPGDAALQDTLARSLDDTGTISRPATGPKAAPVSVKELGDLQSSVKASANRIREIYSELGYDPKQLRSLSTVERDLAEVQVKLADETLSPQYKRALENKQKLLTELRTEGQNLVRSRSQLAEQVAQQHGFEMGKQVDPALLNGKRANYRGIDPESGQMKFEFVDEAGKGDGFAHARNPEKFDMAPRKRPGFGEQFARDVAADKARYTQDLIAEGAKPGRLVDASTSFSAFLNTTFSKETWTRAGSAIKDAAGTLFNKGKEAAPSVAAKTKNAAVGAGKVAAEKSKGILAAVGEHLSPGKQIRLDIARYHADGHWRATAMARATGESALRGLGNITLVRPIGKGLLRAWDTAADAISVRLKAMAYNAKVQDCDVLRRGIADLRGQAAVVQPRRAAKLQKRISDAEARLAKAEADLQKMQAPVKIPEAPVASPPEAKAASAQAPELKKVSQAPDVSPQVAERLRAIDPDLEILRSMGDPDQIPELLRIINDKHPQGFPGRYGEVVFADIPGVFNRGLVTVDQAGKLVYLDDPAAISTFIDEVAVVKGLGPIAVRERFASAILRRPLADAEVAAILDAHDLPGFGNIGYKAAKGKFRPVIEAFAKEYALGGFTRQEALQYARLDAQALAKRGILGRPVPPPTAMRSRPTFGPKPPPPHAPNAPHGGPTHSPLKPPATPTQRINLRQEFLRDMKRQQDVLRPMQARIQQYDSLIARLDDQLKNPSLKPDQVGRLTELRKEYVRDRQPQIDRATPHKEAIASYEQKIVEFDQKVSPSRAPIQKPAARQVALVDRNAPGGKLEKADRAILGNAKFEANVYSVDGRQCHVVWVIDGNASVFNGVGRQSPVYKCLTSAEKTAERALLAEAEKMLMQAYIDAQDLLPAAVRANKGFVILRQGSGTGMTTGSKLGIHMNDMSVNQLLGQLLYAKQTGDYRLVQSTLSNIKSYFAHEYTHNLRGALDNMPKLNANEVPSHAVQFLSVWDQYDTFFSSRVSTLKSNPPKNMERLHAELGGLRLIQSKLESHLLCTIKPKNYSPSELKRAIESIPQAKRQEVLKEFAKDIVEAPMNNFEQYVVKVFNGNL